MSNTVEAIKVLLVEDSLEEAERLPSMLRNAGITVRATHAHDAAELDSQLLAQTPDLILFGTTASLALADVVQAAGRGGKDIASIVLLDVLSEDAISDALHTGANAIALRTRADQFVAVVRREFDSLNMRRSVRRLEASLRESERRCDALLESSRDPIAYVHEGMHVRANKAYLDVFGYSDFAEIEGVSILDMIAPEAADAFKTLLKNLSKGKKPPPKLDVKARRSNGAAFDAVIEFTEASFAGEPCQQVVLRQQTANADLAREIDALRSKDLVTDLYNRQYGLTELDRMIASVGAGASDQLLLLVEPDNFRKLLDTIGIGNADLLLGDMANLLRRHIDPSDLACRFGEHTFAVLVHGRDPEATRLLTQTLCRTFGEHIFEIGKQSIGASISIGGSLIGEKNANAQAVLAQASNALRAAQEQGGNQVNIVDPGVQDRAAADQTRDTLKRIKAAIADNSFVLYHQPIVSLHGAEGEFYEVLLRMRGDKGDVSPKFFLPVAEENGLLPAIDRSVIGNAIRELGARERAGKRTTFFVKLSAPSLDDPGLLPWISQQLNAARVRGDALVFEMPESKVITHLKPARSFVNNLKQLHCGFALEQFGSGLNSFQLLKHVDAGYLKIDRNFMVDLTKNKEHQDFIRQFCNQAHQAGKLTIAEFVEDAASMSLLFICGVNFVQGHFLSEQERVIAAT
jgi:diguanylate cyclase (GGDEF)-like protein/PAS domain S-box-containing protein